MSGDHSGRLRTQRGAHSRAVGRIGLVEVTKLAFQRLLADLAQGAGQVVEPALPLRWRQQGEQVAGLGGVVLIATAPIASRTAAERPACLAVAKAGRLAARVFDVREVEGCNGRTG